MANTTDAHVDTDRQIGELMTKNRLLNWTVAMLALLAMGFGAWGIWQASSNDDAAPTARYEKAAAKSGNHDGDHRRSDCVWH